MTDRSFFKNNITAGDKKFLQIALKKAYENLGNVFPNPSVGSVLVKDGVIIKKSVTTRKAHSEALLFADLDISQTENATLYVTLEPCVHQGKNPPCVDVLIKNKIARVVIGAIDPNPLVAGKSLEILHQNNIAVTVANDSESFYLHRYFFHFITQKMPHITAKLAVSMDGKIALANGKSQWITAADSRSLVHLMRSRCDAILTSIGTVRADNPRLNCRINGYYRDKTIILLDKNLEINLDAAILKNIDKAPLWIICADNAPQEKRLELEKLGVQIFNFTPEIIKNDMKQIMAFLASKDITSLFCEAGGLITKLYKEELISELILFRAPKILGSDAKSMIEGLELEELDQAKQWQIYKEQLLYSGDRVEYYELIKSR